MKKKTKKNSKGVLTESEAKNHYDCQFSYKSALQLNNVAFTLLHGIISFLLTCMNVENLNTQF